MNILELASLLNCERFIYVLGQQNITLIKTDSKYFYNIK